MKLHEQAVFRFGRFVLVPSERMLLSDGKPLAMTGKAFDLLVTLVRHPGRLLTKDELLQAVWPGVVVEEVNLSVNVSALRKVLGAAPAGEWVEKSISMTAQREKFERFAGNEYVEALLISASLIKASPTDEGLSAVETTDPARQVALASDADSTR